MTKKGLIQLILSVLLMSAFGPITYVAKSADISTATTSTPTPTATSTPTPTATSTPATNTCSTQGVVNRPDWDSVSWTEYCAGNQIFNIVFVIKGGKQIRVVGNGSSVSASDVPSTTSTPAPTPTATSTSTPTRTESTTATSTPSTPAPVINCLSAGATVTRLDWDSGNWTEICSSSQIFDFFLIIKGEKKLRVVSTGRSVSVTDVVSELNTPTTTKTETSTATTTKTETSTATTTKTETSTATSLTPVTCLTRGAIVNRPDWDSGNWTEICKPPQTFDFILIIKNGLKLRVVGGPSGVSISDYYYPSEIKQLTTTQSDTRTVTTQSDTRTVTTQSAEKQYTQLVIASIPDSKTRTAETALLLTSLESPDKEKVLTVVTKTNKSVVMTVATEIPEVKVQLTATKANSKTITFNRTTNTNGTISITTRLPLSGYLITLSINGIKIDTDPIKSIRGKI